SATADEGVRVRQAGWTPVRRGWNGTVPAPGWTGTYDWDASDRRRDDRSSHSVSGPGDVAAAANSVARQRRIEAVLSATRALSIRWRAIVKPGAAWFGGRGAAARDELLRAALASAVDAADGRRNGVLAAWGSLHTALFRHPLALNAAMRERLNAGPFQRPGYG